VKAHLYVMACFVLVTFAPQSRSADVELRPPSNRPQWVAQANRLIAELSHVIEVAKPFPAGNPIADRKRAEQLIWKLWLLTGMPPDRGSEAEWKAISETHVNSYKQFVMNHAHWTEKQLVRHGIRSAADAFGSSMCYMTMRYVNEKTGNTYPRFISTTPSHTIHVVSLSDSDRAFLRAEYVRWLATHFKHSNWQPSHSQFRLPSGRPVGMQRLVDAIRTAMSRRRFSHYQSVQEGVARPKSGEQP